MARQRLSIIQNIDRKTKIYKNKRWLILAAPFLVGGFLMLLSILYYGVNTIYWDEWELVTIFQKADNHTLGFADFWAQHNEHRIFFPNIVLTSAAYVTHWNLKAELLINFMFSIVTALMLYLFVLTKVKKRHIAILASTLVAAWFYSPVQFENWLWGWQLEWFMCVTGIVTSIYFIDRFCSYKHNNRHWFLFAAMLSAVIATYSLGAGILVWPVGLLMLLLYKQSKRPVGVWLMGAVFATAIYYYHYVHPLGNPSTSLFLHQRLNFIKYILCYLGRPISSNILTAMLVGSVLISLLIPLAYMVWLKRDKMEKFVPWIALIVLPLMSATITSVSRLGFGLVESNASRYTAFSLLYIIGLIGLTCAIIDTVRINRKNFILVILITIATCGPTLLASYVYGVHEFKERSAMFREIRACTHEPKPSTSCLSLTYPAPNLARNRLNYLKSKHWAGF